MIDEKKLIEELHILRDVMDYEGAGEFQKGFVSGVDKAIQSVVEMDRIENGLYEKSIPKKPVAVEIYEDVLCLECPNCGMPILNDYQGNYCSECGQPLKWRDY